jgi:hypothetical protein
MIFWGVSDKRLPFGIAVRSRVLQEEGNIATNSAGYSFGVVTPHYDFFLTGLGTSRIEDQFTNTLAAGIDNLQFHDYLFTGVPGSGSKLVRDGQNIGSSKDRTYPFGAPTNYISLGDSTAGTNARAETTAYSFTQPQITTQNPAPGTVVNPGSAVALGIQEGPATQTVPNVVGQTQPNAQAAIGNAGCW